MPPLAAGVLVFCAAAAVLVLEILAGRLLAPYVGVTIETFTGIIGTVLAGISFGTWIGGKLADRYDPRRLLGPTLVIGGLFALVAPPIVDFLGAGLRGARPGTIVTLAFAGFFAPAAVLSAVTPTVVKLQLADLAETGRVVGRLSALATAGAIFGTFVTGFLLVAAAPTRPVVTGLGVVLVLGGLGMWAWLHPDGARGVPPSAVVVALLAGALSLAAADPCDRESAYFCARVEADPDRPSGRVLWLDTLRHSYVDLDDPTHLEFVYTRILGDVVDAMAPAGEALDVLHLGGGGFTLPRYVAATRPGSTSLVLEIDPLLLQIATEELGLVTGPDLEVVTGDARLTLRGVPLAAYDLSIGDAFGGVSVPWHLTTVEFLEAVRDRLRPGGVYAMNLIDHGPLDFVRAEVATLREVFGHVALVALPERLAGEHGGNFVAVASVAPLPLDAILAAAGARGGREEALTGDGLRRFADGASLLTDDFAPADQLLTPHPPARRG